MFREQCCDRQDEFNANFMGNNDVNMDVDINVANVPMGNQLMPMNSGAVTSPVMEPVQERVVNRTIMHEVPQV